jgi:uncharacterized protein (DUF2344 family)
MNQEKATDVAKGIFKSYPDAKELFVTSDEQVFFAKGNAETHANSTLKDNVVVDVKREDVGSLDGKSTSNEKAIEKAKQQVVKAEADVEAKQKAVTDAGDNAAKKKKAEEALAKSNEKLEAAKTALADIETPE